MFITIFAANPDITELRATHRAAHDDYWSTRLDSLKLAGPLLTDDGNRRVGHILVLDVPDRQAVETIVVNDPFVKAGVYASWKTYRFNLSVGG